MKIMGWLAIVPKLMPLVIGAVHAVEAIADGKKGKDKQDAAIDAIGAMIPALQLSLPPGVFQSVEFQELLRKLIDAYVAMQNFIALKNKEASTSK